MLRSSIIVATDHRAWRSRRRIAPGLLTLAIAASMAGVSYAQAEGSEQRFEEVVVLTAKVASPAEIAEGLFPEDRLSQADREMRERCMRIRLAGYTCAPPGPRYVRYLLPGVSFSVGSYALPDAMKLQLRGFADALRGRKSTAQAVRLDGHADVTGTAEFNRTLSLRRAEAAREFLVSLGVDPAMISVHGFGSDALRNQADPTAAENRRIEIARDLGR